MMMFGVVEFNEGFSMDSAFELLVIVSGFFKN